MADIQQLIDGFRQFQQDYFEDDQALFSALSQGQNPSTLVIACSDSRVDPAIVMNAKPGDLFVVRNVANLVPPYEKGGGYHGVSAALEFGVCGLQVKNIIVMGHRQCGGIKALIEGVPGSIDTEFIRPWVSIAKPALDRVIGVHPEVEPTSMLCECELEAIKVSLENLMSFHFIRTGVEQGTLTLHGWYFDIEKGSMSVFDPASNAFKQVSQW
jgi:carbonic anhydrase